MATINPLTSDQPCRIQPSPFLRTCILSTTKWPLELTHLTRVMGATGTGTLVMISMPVIDSTPTYLSFHPCIREVDGE